MGLFSFLLSKLLKPSAQSEPPRSDPYSADPSETVSDATMMVPRIPDEEPEKDATDELMDAISTAVMEKAAAPADPKTDLSSHSISSSSSLWPDERNTMKITPETVEEPTELIVSANISKFEMKPVEAAEPEVEAEPIEADEPEVIPEAEIEPVETAEAEVMPEAEDEPIEAAEPEEIPEAEAEPVETAEPEVIPEIETEPVDILFAEELPAAETESAAEPPVYAGPKQEEAIPNVHPDHWGENLSAAVALQNYRQTTLPQFDDEKLRLVWKLKGTGKKRRQRVICECVKDQPVFVICNSNGSNCTVITEEGEEIGRLNERDSTVYHEVVAGNPHNLYIKKIRMNDYNKPTVKILVIVRERRSSR